MTTINSAVLESALTGLVIAVSAVLLHVARDHLGSVCRWLRYGFAVPADGRKAAGTFLFTGVLMFAVYSMTIRTLDAAVPETVRLMVSIPAWALMGYGAYIWQAIMMSEAVTQRGGDGRRAGRRLLFIYVAWTAIVVSAAAWYHPFHKPVSACPIAPMCSAER